MSNGIELLSYSDIAQVSGPESDVCLPSVGDLNFSLLGVILAVLCVLYRGLKHFLKRA